VFGTLALAFHTAFDTVVAVNNLGGAGETW
jgi:hypothetical protein